MNHECREWIIESRREWVRWREQTAATAVPASALAGVVNTGQVVSSLYVYQRQEIGTKTGSIAIALKPTSKLTTNMTLKPTRPN